MISLTPMLYVTDLQGTIAFYTEILGFICRGHEPDWGWASLQRDDVEIMLALPNAHEPFERPTFTGSLYVRTDSVDELWEHLRDKATVVYPIENFDYGMREFAIRDNNGYILQFGQSLQE